MLQSQIDIIHLKEEDYDLNKVIIWKQRMYQRTKSVKRASFLDHTS